MLVEYRKSASAWTTTGMAVLKTACVDAVKTGPDLTIAGFVNELVNARVNLNSTSARSGAVFKELLMTAFVGSPVVGYITQVLNTDSIPVQTVAQGHIDRCEELHNQVCCGKGRQGGLSAQRALTVLAEHSHTPCVLSTPIHLDHEQLRGAELSEVSEIAPVKVVLQLGWVGTHIRQSFEVPLNPGAVLSNFREKSKAV